MTNQRGNQGVPIHTSGHEPWADKTPPQRP